MSNPATRVTKSRRLFMLSSFLMERRGTSTIQLQPARYVPDVRAHDSLPMAVKGSGLLTSGAQLLWFDLIPMRGEVGCECARAAHDRTPQVLICLSALRKVMEVTPAV